MEMDFSQPVLPGETFETSGEFVKTREGQMQCRVTLRTVFSRTDGYWMCEIIGVDKPEWEWTLGSNVVFSTDFVKEQISRHV